MPTNFPGGLDSFTNPTATQPQNNPSHSQQHANANDAIAALETKVGVDGSTNHGSLDYRVTALEQGTLQVWNETPRGTIDGINAVFTLAGTPLNGMLMLCLNGLIQQAGAANDFTISGATITYNAPPPVGSVLLASYLT